MKLKKSVYSYVMMLGHLCADLGSGALPAILPYLMAQKGITYTQAAGLTFALSGIGSAIQPICGNMADKTSRPWLMALGIFMSGCGVCALGFLNSYTAMFFAVMITGIGSALFHPDGGRMANYVSGEKKGRGLSLFSVGGNMGGAVGPALLVFGITLMGGLKGTVILAIPTVLMALFLIAQQRTLGDFAKEGMQATRAAMDAGQTDDWKGFGRLTAVVFLRSTLQTAMSTFFPMVWLYLLMQGEAKSGFVTTILALAGSAATLIGGGLADRIGFSKTIRLGLALTVPSLILFILSRNVILSTLLLIPCAGFLNFAFSPSVALGQKFLPNHLGLASGITMGLANSFGGVVSPLLGRVADTVGLTAVLWIMTGISLAACLASFFLKDASY